MDCRTAPQGAVVLGSGPIRIGQGVEFDYCCVHCAWALSAWASGPSLSTTTPRTVSTDYDTADTLYFEPLTSEEVWNVLDVEQPRGLWCSLADRRRSNWPSLCVTMAIPCWAPTLWTSTRRRTGNALTSSWRRRVLAPPRGQDGFYHGGGPCRRGGDRLSCAGAPQLCAGGAGMTIAYDETPSGSS